MKFKIKGLTDEIIERNIRVNKIGDYISSIIVYLLTLYLACVYYIPNNEILEYVLLGAVIYTIIAMMHTILFKYDNVENEVIALKEYKIKEITQKGSIVILELLDGTELKSVLLKQVIKSKYNTDDYIDLESGIVYIKDNK